MHMHSLKLLRPMVLKEMHLQENTLFDHDIGVNVTRNIAQYPLHHVTNAATKFEVARSNGLGGDTFTSNETDTQTHGRTERRRTDFGMEFLYPKEKNRV